jgi:hypothetical protein
MFGGTSRLPYSYPSTLNMKVRSLDKKVKVPVFGPNRQQVGTCRALLAVCFMLVTCLAYPSTLKMEAIYSSEMSVDVHQTTRPSIPESKTLQRRCSYSTALGRVMQN